MRRLRIVVGPLLPATRQKIIYSAAANPVLLHMAEPYTPGVGIYSLLFCDGSAWSTH